MALMGMAATLINFKIAVPFLLFDAIGITMKELGRPFLNIDHAAHLSGLLFGFLVVTIFLSEKTKRKYKRDFY